ncbi:thioredoxin domain-containing protein [Streptomyces sp. NPDC018031]|uniref:thioredoxin domain-containing protein n=1 Tax=Streptomyces sp. NPDC018031 TaxID=3365033 RepID=UPI0037B5C174
MIGYVAAAVAVALLATGAIVVFSDGDDGDGGGQGIGDAAPTAPGLPGSGDGPGAGDTGGGTTGGSTGGSTEGPAGTGGNDGPKEAVAPAHTTGADGLVIAVGKKDSAHTLTVYEDMRCPVCATFEQQVGETVLKDIEAGKYKAEFRMAAFLDDSFQGSGSKNALSALGAALDVGPDAFLAYKKALFSEANHPAESTDSFASDDYLLKVAREVPALNGNAGFTKDVTNGTYDAWAEAVAADFMKSGISGVPALELDGRKVTSDGTSPPLTADDYTKAVDNLL